MRAGIRKRLLPWLLLAAGVGVAVYLVKTGPRPTQRELQEGERLVSAIEVTPLDVTPWITGYGEVQPERTWKAVSQVSGKLVKKARKLKDGEFFKAGEPMLQLDEREIKLSIQKGQAEIAKYRAKIEELKNQRANLEARLDLARQVLSFNEKEQARQRKLFSSRAVSSVAVEEKEIDVLKQRGSIAELETTIKLIPSQIAYQEAEVASAEAGVKQSELDLSYTKIVAPFDCRTRDVSVEDGQYVTVGQEMFAAELGGGAFLNGRRIHVSKAAGLEVALLSTGFPSRKRHENVNIHFFHQVAMITHGVRRGGSAAIDLAYVACGRLDGFWEFGLNPWDMAAGLLIVREAGGRTSDMLGGPALFDGKHIAVTNSLIHDPLLSLFGDVFQGRYRHPIPGL